MIFTFARIYYFVSTCIIALEHIYDMINPLFLYGYDIQIN